MDKTLRTQVSLIVQNYLADEAKQSGVMETESTDVGEVITNLCLEDSTLSNDSEEPVKSVEKSGLEGEVRRIEDSLKELYNMISDLKATITSMPTVNTVAEVVTEDEHETESLSTETEVLLTKATY